VEKLPADGGLVERQYDLEGRLVQETKSVKGNVREVLGYEHDKNGNVTLKTRKSSEGLEAWKYSYTDLGRLSSEEYFFRSVRLKVTLYGEGKLRTEEHYRDGELFLKVFYDGDAKLREEVYSNGTMRHERSYK
jgi:hypothetical protein